MFSGIVGGKVSVEKILDAEGIRSITVKMTDKLLNGLEIGASVSVNGVCLTATTILGNSVCFDVIQETMRLTNLGNLAAGSLVNIERSVRLGDEIGGHIVSGHIHGQAEVKSIIEDDNNLMIIWMPPPRLQKYLMAKGYVALDGISLTLGQNDQGSDRTVSLIPETRRVTNINQVKVGYKFNLEIDSQTQAIVSAVERVLDSKSLI